MEDTMKYTVVCAGEHKETSTSTMEIANIAKKYAAQGNLVYVEYDDGSGDTGFYNPDGKHGDVPREWRK
jgi:hypothetical protein